MSNSSSYDLIRLYTDNVFNDMYLRRIHLQICGKSDENSGVFLTLFTYTH